MIRHAGEQVASSLVGLRERHAVGLGEHLQQIGACKVSVAEVPSFAAMQESGRSNTPVVTIAGGYGLLNRAVLGVGVARGATEAISCFGDESAMR